VEANPLRIFGLLGNSDLAPDTAPLDLGAGMGEVVQPAMPRAGHLFEDRFLIQSSLGQGAFGEVMRAHDQSLDRDVAIKFLFRRSPGVRERFRREAQTTASLDHPNVLGIHEFRLDGERPYIVYELIEEAKTLDEAFLVATLPERLDLFEQTLAGVAAAHAAGVIHRDLKPENVLVRQDGQVRVADFGLARTDESKLTATGAFLGTPAYMAPEQVTGGGASPASDVWSLGMILYEAIYGECWSAGFVTPQELLASICAANISRPRGGPKALGDLLFKRVLRVRPADRLPDASAFLTALKEARSAGSHRGPGVALAALAAGFVLGGLASWAVVDLGAGGAEKDSALAAATSPPASPAPAAAATTSGPSPSAQPTRSPAPLLAYGDPVYFERRRRFRLASPEELLREAERGDSAAMRVLAYRSLKGWRCEKDPAAAKLWWERAARAGCPDSLEALSVHYREAGDEEQARAHHAQALEAGSSYAIMIEADSRGELREGERDRVERLVSQGDELAAARMVIFALKYGTQRELRTWTAIGVALGAPEAMVVAAIDESHARKPDFARIQRYLAAGRAAGLEAAYTQQSLWLALGQGVEQDLAAAERALEEAARLGASPEDLAYYRIRLAAKRMKGSSQTLDVEEDINLCLRSGSPHVRGELGLFLISFTRRSKARNRDIRRAAGTMLRRAKRSNNPLVHLSLGKLIEAGELPSPRADAESAEAYRRAAECSWYRAAGWGVALLKGKGVDKDLEQGVLWLKRAAQAGDRNAWRLLGIAYSTEPEIPELNDPALALRYFDKGVELGSAEAAVGAGAVLAVAGKHERARRYFALGAERGSVGGSVNLALCWVNGRGGPKDPEEAVRLLEAVEAKRRTPQLCRFLARCYREGVGAAKSPALAAEWEERALGLEKR
jgi:TPR repeat protein